MFQYCKYVGGFKDDSLSHFCLCFCQQGMIFNVYLLNVIVLKVFFCERSGTNIRENGLAVRRVNLVLSPVLFIILAHVLQYRSLMLSCPSIALRYHVLLCMNATQNLVSCFFSCFLGYKCFQVITWSSKNEVLCLCSAADPMMPITTKIPPQIKLLVSKFTC